MYPSAAAIPQTNGIQTISKYKYLHRRRTRPYATQYLLCGEIKEELKLLKQSITEIPFQELIKQVQDLTRNLEIRMCAIEFTYKTLKDIILQRTKQQSQLDSYLLERWNPSETVLRYSPWACMRMMLNLVAEDNITDLFPNDWQPVSPQSTTQQKHFQVLTEVMTELFLHCGLANDEWVIEVTNYQDFLNVLLHHFGDGEHIHNTDYPVYHSDGIHVHLQDEALL